MTEPLNTDRSWSYVTSEGSKLPPGVSTQWNPSPKAQRHLMKSDADQAEDSVVWDFSKKKFVLLLWKDLFVEMAGCPSPARCSPFPSAHSYGPLPLNLLAKDILEHVVLMRTLPLKVNWLLTGQWKTGPICGLEINYSALLRPLRPYSPTGAFIWSSKLHTVNSLQLTVLST